MDIKRVGDHECINCGECISVCPTQAISWKGSKILLHKDAIDEQAPVVKPLAFEDGSYKIAQDGDMPYEQSAALSEKTDVSVANMSVTDMSVKADVAVEYATFDTEEAVEGFKPVAKVKSSKRPKKSVKFWLEMTAWILAVAILVTALVCYNFVDVEKVTVPPPSSNNGPDDNEDPNNNPIVQVGNKVGDTAPDFTIKLYGEDGEFNLYGNRGKVTVVNFWATWCTPCVEEIPYFNELAEKHPELSVIAVHGSSTSDVEKFILRKGWSGNALTFAQDNLDGTKCLTFNSFGGTTMWPMTVVIDGEGKILYNSTQSFKNYAQLEALILDLLAE